MVFRIGIENNNDGIRSIAWVLEHPGCYAYGLNTDTALVASAEAIRAYSAWIERHEPSWVEASQIEVGVEEIWTNYDIARDYERVEKGDYSVESWFLHDWKPLTGEEIERAVKLLSWSRADLDTVIGRLSSEQWKHKPDGDRWDIAGIVRHVGGAEWWYLDRLGLAFPRKEVPSDPLERLGKTRDRFLEVLPTLEGKEMVRGANGEFWSPRKVLRRALWHERDHTEHIQKLLK